MLTFPIAPISAVAVPIIMWTSLRWLEDAVSAFRAFAALARLLWMGRARMLKLQVERSDLHGGVMDLAINTIGLPADPEKFFAETGRKEKGRVRGKWASSAKYFSLRRRRKRDWNETLRLYDKVDYPDDPY